MGPALERLLTVVACLLMVGGGYGALLALCRGTTIHADELVASVATVTGMAILCWLLWRAA